MHSVRARRNLLRTIVFLVVLGLSALFVASRFGSVGFWLGVVLVAVLTVYVCTRAGEVAIRAMRAYPVGEAEQPALCRLVRDLTARARVPMPRLYVSPTRAANALATGNGPSRAAICVTEGALDVLDERELRAVIAHELAHIRRRDTLPGSMVGLVSRAAMVIPVLGVVVVYATRLVVSGSREFEADQEAARITGEPLALAGALRKLDAAQRELVLPPDAGVVATSHLMISSPLGQPRGVWRLFRSHPSTAERVARLEGLAGYRR
ncbi:M48 family metalloprotease [Phytoactinopolyspora endophytica]|uniref:M48 family metalloprotease n=1 Tax=Phytoactinopolyspora endophytica TaxID=1642495 RepID=UPI00197BE9CE|nr:M48 family metalloprotease [Phytoactinopolyspora endophytica]